MGKNKRIKTEDEKMVSEVFETLTILGIGFGLLGGLFYGIQRVEDHYNSLQIDTTKVPVLEDVNKDGLDDLVLKFGSGDDLVLYKTNEGYSYQNPRGE